MFKPKTRRVAWLVERAGDKGTEYLCWPVEAATADWHTCPFEWRGPDPSKAVQFSRKEDAVLLAEMVGDGDAVEHQWQ